MKVKTGGATRGDSLKAGRLFCLLVLCLGIAGCATAGPKMDKESVARLETGITTQEDVLKIFGPPNNMNFNQDGEVVFTYVGIHAKNSFWNFIPVVCFVHGETNLTNQILIITFKDNVVKDHTFSSTRTPLKYGLIS